MKTYCAKCEMWTEKVATRDKNGETLLTCAKGHFIKIPKGGDVKVIIAQHNEANAPPTT